MTTESEFRHIVAGVNTHKRTHHAAVLAQRLETCLQTKSLPPLKRLPKLMSWRVPRPRQSRPGWWDRLLRRWLQRYLHAQGAR
jgi:hypothetical protein